MLARISNSQRPQKYALCIFTQVIALTAKIKVVLVASAFYVLKILVFKECFSLLPAGWDRMMTASQPLSAILDISVHLCLRKKRHFLQLRAPITFGKFNLLFKTSPELESTTEQLVPCLANFALCTANSDPDQQVNCLSLD